MEPIPLKIVKEEGEPLISFYVRLVNIQLKDRAVFFKITLKMCVIWDLFFTDKKMIKLEAQKCLPFSQTQAAQSCMRIF